MAQAITTKTTETVGMDGAAATPATTWRGTLLRLALVVGLAVAFTLVFAPMAHAAPLGEGPDPSPWILTAVDWLKKCWGVVFLAEMVAALMYIASFYLQGVFPSLFQPFQGEWMKKALLIGLLAQPVFFFLVSQAEAAAKGI